MWPRRQDTVSRPGRKPTALCPVDGLCFAWVPSARAGRHSREEESFLPVRPWSAVDPYLQSTPMQVKQHEQIEARLAPFMWKTILDTTVLIAEDLGAGSTSLVLTQVEC